jgi:hypothetical protein
MAWFHSRSVDVERMVADLTSWSCAEGLELLDCLLSLAAHLTRHSHLTEGEEREVGAWVEGYRQAGGLNPPRAREQWTGVRKISEVKVALGKQHHRVYISI